VGSSGAGAGARTQRRLINFLCLPVPAVSFERTFDPGRRRSEVAPLSTAYSDQAATAGIFPANARDPSRTFAYNAVLRHLPPLLPSHFRLSVANYACPVFAWCIQVHSSGVQSPSRSTGQAAPESRALAKLRSRARSSTGARVDLSRFTGRRPFVHSSRGATLENEPRVRSALRELDVH